MVFAPVEFVVTVGVGIPLFLGWAVVNYIEALLGLFRRALLVAKHRFLVGRIHVDERTPARLYGVPEHRQETPQSHLPGWLN
jgi:hypothetical protein